jgi:hypothetical protein
MYSSYFPAVWHGNAHYGFSKEVARMRWQGGIFVATREDGSLLLHADTAASTGQTPPGLLPIVLILRLIYSCSVRTFV